MRIYLCTLYKNIKWLEWLVEGCTEILRYNKELDARLKEKMFEKKKQTKEWKYIKECCIKFLSNMDDELKVALR